MRNILAILVLSLMLAPALPSMAVAADGSISATSFRPIPAGTAITVRPWDNSDENLRLQKEFEGALRRQGYAVKADAPLVLSFETRDILGQWNVGARRSVLEIESRGGRTGGEDAKVRLNLFASDRGGVFNKGADAPDVVPSKYQIDVTLDDQGGVRLWQGRAAVVQRRSDGFTLTRSMIPIVVESIGKTLKRKSFDIP